MPVVDEEVRVRVTVSGVEQGAEQFQNFQTTTTRAMSESEAAITRSLKNMASQFIGLAAAARAIKNVASSGVEFNKFVENTTMSFTVMMKSAEKAQAQMKDLYDFAVNSPLTFKETAASSKQLMAYGFAAEELIPTMKTLGSVAIATGHSLDDIAYVYGTLKSQGRAYSRDLMQFGMRGIPIYEELAKVLDVDVSQIQKMASEGKIGFEEVEKAFQNMTTNGGRFAGVIEGYMTTLTGKLSMLGDIAEQSFGTLMSGVTANIKTFVDSLTDILSSKGFQEYINSVGDGLGTLSKVLSNILELLLLLLPTITKIAKVIIGLVIIKSITSMMGDLSKVILKLASGMVSFGSSVATLPALFGELTASVGLLGDAFASLFTFFATNPIGLAILGLSAVAAGTAAVVNHITKTRESNIASKDEAVRRGQLEKDVARASAYGGASKASGGASILGASDVAMMVEKYKLAESTVVSILAKNDLLTRAQYEQYKLQAANTTDAKAYAEAISNAKGFSDGLATSDEKQQAFLSELNNKYKSITEYSNTLQKNVERQVIDMDVYKKADTDITPGAMGGKAAKEFLAGVDSTFASEKISWGAAYDEAKEEENIKNAIASIQDALDKGRLVEGLFSETSYDENLQAAKEAYEQMLEDIKKKKKETAKAVTLPDTWWNPIVKAASLTVSEMDDLDVAQQQAIESAQKEAQARQDSYSAALKQLSINMRLARADGDVEHQMAIRTQIEDLMKAANHEQAIALQYEKDITAEYEKQKKLKQYEYATGGNEAYWSNKEASAGAGYQKASEISGVTPLDLMQSTLQGIIDSFKSLAPSITNVIQGIKSFNIKDALSSAGTSIATGISQVVAALPAALSTVSTNVLKGTEVGNVQSGGMGIAGVVGQAAIAFASMISSIENVSKVLNPFQTIFESAKEILEPLINNILQPIVDVLEMVGEALAPIIAVLLSGLKPVLSLLYLAIAPLVGLLQLVSAGYVWFYNTVIVNVANMIVEIVNAIIKVLNKLPFVSIRYLDSLDEMTLAVEDVTDALSNQESALDQTISYLTDKLNDAIDDQIDSLQDLYDVGALSTTEYASQVAALNAQKVSESDVLVSYADKQLESTTDILSRLQTLYEIKDQIENDDTLTDTEISELLSSYGLSSASRESLMISAIKAALIAYGAATDSASDSDSASASDSASDSDSGSNSIDSYIPLSKVDWDSVLASISSFASGSGNIPSDMIANIHKGEGIIPATFMDSIRSGELALSSGQNEGSGQIVNVSVTVTGSVTTENDLADSIASNIYSRRLKGAIVT